MHSRTKTAGFLALAAMAVTALSPVPSPVYAQTPPSALDQGEISPEVQSIITQMGKTLSGKAFSFKTRTIREFEHASGYPLHIFHDISVAVQRPDRLAVDVDGDDGRVEMGYDGKALTILSESTKRYMTRPASGTIQEVLREAIEKSGVDFPLGDLIADEPHKAFLSQVKSGVMLGEVLIDGVVCAHMFFVQPPAIEIEAWVEKNDKAYPRRLIVTYRDMPTQPRFISQLYDWNFAPKFSDSEFTIQIPPNATKIEEVRR